MRHSEDTFTGSAATPIFTQSWEPDGDTKAVVVVVHGYAEHSNRYGNLIDALVPRGYALYALDHRGHGRSGGHRAFIDKYDYLLDDLDVVIARAKAAHPDVPLFLLGHSMGGNIALASALRKQDHLKGLVLSGPAASATGAPRLMRWLAALLGRIAPRLGVRSLPATGVSRDPEVVKAYENDPLVYHGKVPARTGASLLKAAKGFPARLPSLTVPLLVVHGSADELVPVETGRAVHATAGSQDKTLKVYEGLAHEVFNEPERAQVLGDVADWLDAHTPAPSVPGNSTVSGS